MDSATDLLGPLLVYLQLSSLWELLAVVLALVYLLLVVIERIECWYVAFFSTLIYLFLFWDVNLLMESALQVYYLAMAVYGWWQWKKPDQSHTGGNHSELNIQVWTLAVHVKVIVGLAIMVIASGYVLSENTQAVLPYLDSFTTWGSVITTYMVARKVLENWLYWIVIDSASIYLYLDRDMYPTVGLFAVYIIVACFGFLQWRHHYRSQES